MSSTASVKLLEEDKLLIMGRLNYQSVPLLCQQTKEILKQNMTVDLAAVEYSNSAGLALLTDWLRYARTKNFTVKFINPPAQMQAIAKVCGLLSVLGF